MKAKILDNIYNFIRKSLSEGIDLSSLPSINEKDLVDESYIRKQYDDKEGFKVIGKGRFGKVLLVKSKEGGKVAVKVIETNNEDLLNDSLNELINLGKISDHPNIITYNSYRLYQVPNKTNVSQLFIEMPLATNSLENILKKNINLPEYEIIEIMRQVLSGLKFAHERNLAHLDLKPDNILIAENKFKIADWGGSLRLKSSGSTTIKSEIAITRGYHAPELDGENYGDKQKYHYYLADVYSMGMIILRLCGVSIQNLRNIPKGVKKYHDQFLKDDLTPELTKKYSKKILNLVAKMTAFEPSERISLNDAIEYLK